MKGSALSRVNATKNSNIIVSVVGFLNDLHVLMFLFLSLALSLCLFSLSIAPVPSSESSSSLEQEKYLQAILGSIPVYFKSNGSNTLSNRSLIGLSPGTSQSEPRIRLFLLTGIFIYVFILFHFIF